MVADMRELPFADARFDSVLVGAVARARAGSRAGARRGRARAQARRRGGVRHPNRLTLGRPDEIIDPYHYVEFTAAELERLCSQRFSRGQGTGLFGSARYMEIFDARARHARPDPRPATRCGSGASSRRGQAAALRRACCAVTAATATRAPRRSRRRTSGSTKQTSTRRSTSARSAGSRAVERVPAIRKARHDPSPLRPWCGAPLDDGAVHLQGRIRCRRCGAATTDPWPTDEELEAAYGDLVPPRGREPVPLRGRRAAAAHPRPARRAARQHRPAGPGARRRRRRRRRCSTRCAAAAASATGLERSSDRADVRDQSTRGRRGGEWAAVVFWHSLEHLPEPGDGDRAGRPPAQARRRARRRRAERRAACRRAAFGDRWLHLDLPRHLVHLSATSLRAGLASSACAIERTSLHARRADRVRLAGRPRRHAAGPPRPLPGTAAARRPERRRNRPRPRALAIAAGGPASAGRAASRPRSRSRCVAAGPSTLRRAVSEQETAGETTTEAKVIVVMPARQAAATLARPSTRSPASGSTRSSSSTTAPPTRRSSSPAHLPFTVVWHPHQVGYGGNQKTCYLRGAAASTPTSS